MQRFGHGNVWEGRARPALRFPQHLGAVSRDVAARRSPTFATSPVDAVAYVVPCGLHALLEQEIGRPSEPSLHRQAEARHGDSCQSV